MSNYGSSDSDSEGVTEAERHVKAFLRQALAWARDNADRIDNAYDSEGGWEVWLEIELYLKLKGAGLTVSRQPGYKGEAGRGRADLYLGNTILVELKVETHSESADAYGRRVAADIQKIDAKAKKRSAMVVAITRTVESEAAMKREFTSDGVKAGVLRFFWDTTTAL